ncbi:hypothetical protein HA402_003353 [Bradysia odoriphaga]|nr:hypothetical protein HA402_003353 [Bradysia odoriphaga]
MDTKHEDLTEYKIVPETRPIWKKRRYQNVVLAFWAFIMVHSLRTNLSVAIVSMSKEFGWDTQRQGVVLSSFFYGYISTQLFGGWMARKIGGHILLGVGVGSTAVLTLFSPLAARSSSGAFIALRTIMGVVEGVAFPSIYEVWSKWAPPLERSRMAGTSYAGTYVGSVIALSTCGVIAEQMSWDWIFYIYGLVGIVWWVMWASFVRGRPETDPWISDEEKNYILACLQRAENKKASSVPWLAIATSVPFYAIIISHFAENWGLYTMLTQLPTYMNHSLNFDLSSSGFLSSVPYLSLGIVLFFVSYLADWVQKRGFLTTGQTRKYFNCSAFLAQVLFMMLTAYQSNTTLIIVFLTFGAAIGSFAICGYGVNHLDIAPNYASILMGISNTIGSIPGIVSPILTGTIVTEQSNSEQWKWIFIIAAIIYGTGAITFWFMSSGQVQDWAVDKPDVETPFQNKSIDSLNTDVTTDEKHHEIVAKESR